MKNFDLEDVYSNNALTEDVISLIGTDGYFSNEMIKEINEGFEKHQLSHLIIDTNGMHFVTDDQSEYTYFLPADKVREIKEEKKYRPFKSIDEFKEETGLDLLSIVQYRFNYIGNQSSLLTIDCGVITNFHIYAETDYRISIGDKSYNFDDLFNYEYLADGVWKHFGVEVKDESIIQ